MRAIKVIACLLWTGICAAIALTPPTACYLVWYVVSPQTELGKIALAALLLMMGVGPCIAAAAAGVVFWMTGVTSVLFD